VSCRGAFIGINRDAEAPIPERSWAVADAATMRRALAAALGGETEFLTGRLAPAGAPAIPPNGLAARRRISCAA